MHQPVRAAVSAASLASPADCLANTGASALPLIVFAVLVAVGGLTLLYVARKRTAAQRMTLLLIAGLALGGGLAASGASSSGAWAADSVGAAGACSPSSEPPAQLAPTPAPAPTTAPPAGSVMAATPVDITCTGVDVSVELTEVITPSTSVEGVPATITSVTWADGSATSTVGPLIATIAGTTVTVSRDGVDAPVPGPWVFTYIATDSFGNTVTSAVTLSEPNDNPYACGFAGGGGGNN